MKKVSFISRKDLMQIPIGILILLGLNLFFYETITFSSVVRITVIVIVLYYLSKIIIISIFRLYENYFIKKYGKNLVCIKEIKLPIEKYKEFDLILKRIKHEFKIKAIKKDENIDKYQFESQKSWKSFGETIEIELDEKTKSEKMLKIRLSSKPKNESTTVDYGKNKDNVEKLTRLIIG